MARLIKKRSGEQKAGGVGWGKRKKSDGSSRKKSSSWGSLVQSSSPGTNTKQRKSNRPPTTSRERMCEERKDAYLAGDGLHVRDDAGAARRRRQHHRRRAERAVLAAACRRGGAGAVVERGRRAAPRGAPRPLLLLRRIRGAGRRGAPAAGARALPARHGRPGQPLPPVVVGRLAPRGRPAGEVGAAERADDVGGRRDQRAGIRVDGRGHGCWHAPKAVGVCSSREREGRRRMLEARGMWER
jgi:hypothetical protein